MPVPGVGAVRLHSALAFLARTLKAMREVPPRRPSQVPVQSDALVASALAYARPLALAARNDRLGGARDAVVAEEYRALRARVWLSATLRPSPACGSWRSRSPAAPGHRGRRPCGGSRLMKTMR